MMIVKATVFAFYLWRVFPETAVICVLHCMLSIACLLRLRCCITSLCSVVSGHHRLDQIQKNLLGDLTQPAVTAEKKALTKTKFVCVYVHVCAYACVCFPRLMFPVLILFWNRRLQICETFTLCMAWTCLGVIQGRVRELWLWVCLCPGSLIRPCNSCGRWGSPRLRDPKLSLLKKLVALC